MNIFKYILHIEIGIKIFYVRMLVNSILMLGAYVEYIYDYLMANILQLLSIDQF